jgi:GNAT superfamily N-acetyltransferase
MNIRVVGATYEDIRGMRELYRREMDCQIVRDSLPRRGLSDAYLINAEGVTAGYGAVGGKIDKGRVMEFYLLPEFRAQASVFFGELLVASQATQIEAQTNSPLMLRMLREFATDIVGENFLFHDGFTSQLSSPGGMFRKACESDVNAPLLHGCDTAGHWMIDCDGEIVAVGGFLTHYNPPYGDIFMEVVEHSRRRGFGSYLVQEAKRVCYEAGKKPGARCNQSNIASRKTLEKAGMTVCGEMLAGNVRKQEVAPRT